MRASRWLIFGLGVTMAAGVALEGRTAAGPAGGDPRSLEFPPLREVKVPDAERLVLANGLVVYLLEDHEFPMVDVRTMTRGGATFDPPDRIGLAAMTARVMRTGGSERYPGDELDELIERSGTTLSVGAEEAMFTASLSTLSENLDAGLDLFAEVLLRPSFPEDKIDEARRQQRTDIASRNDESLDIATRELSKLVYGKDSPYGWHTEYATIDAIDAAAMREMHGRFFHPDRTILVATGDFRAGDMKRLIEKKLGRWARSDDPLPPAPSVPASTPAGLYYAEKTDVTQSTILVGGIGIQRNDPIYPAAMVLQDALGGGAGSRLFNEIRTRRGLAYAAGCFISAPFSRPGTVGGYVLTRADSTVTTLRILLHEIERVREEPMTEEEIQRAKDGLLNSFVFEFDSPGEIIARQAQFEFFGYDPDFLTRYQEGVRAVTPADVREAARRVFRPEQWKILVVGNDELFAEKLDSMMPVTELDISIPTASAAVAVPEATPAALEAGQRLLARAVEAHGGEKAIAGVKSLVRAGQGVVHVPGMPGGLQISFRESLALPDRFHLEQVIMGQTMRMAVAGEKGWQTSPAGISDMPSDDVRDFWGDQLGEGGLYFLHRAPSLELQALEPETIDGKRYDVVLVRDSGDAGLKVYFDPESHLVARTSLRTDHPMTGAPVSRMSELSDYRVTEGIRVAHRSRDFLDGELFFEGTVAEIAVNGSIDESVFQKP